jgi:hypothetical protein
MKLDSMRLDERKWRFIADLEVVPRAIDYFANIQGTPYSDSFCVDERARGTKRLWLQMLVWHD